MSEAEAENEIDYREHAEAVKDQANEAFQNGETELAIMYYNQAIDLDPDNHLYYSNRSAAFMKLGFISKALYDAEKCVELAPQWPKGYSRLGTAQHGLKRFQAAIDSYKKGLELDPKNEVMWKSLRLSQEAHEADKRAKQAAAQAEREREEELDRQREEIKRRAAIAKANEKPEAESAALVDDFLAELGTMEKEKEKEPEKDELADFFSSIETKPKVDISTKPLMTEKYVNQELGTPEEEFARVLAPNYEWRNLNPYEVLKLDIDATDEDIRYRYKKLSTKLHPDKLRGQENARDGFEQVKTAYHKLMDRDQRRVIIMNIEYVREEVLKERKKLISKGMKESELPPLEEQISKRTMKQFADIEFQKRKSEHLRHLYNSRERLTEESEKSKLEREEEFEKEWANIERREKRVGNWREFQDEPEAKRVKASSYKEEKRINKKHGQTVLNEWKKKWK